MPVLYYIYPFYIHMIYLGVFVGDAMEVDDLRISTLVGVPSQLSLLFQLTHRVISHYNIFSDFRIQ